MGVLLAQCSVGYQSVVLFYSQLCISNMCHILSQLSSDDPALTEAAEKLFSTSDPSESEADVSIDELKVASLF